MSQSFEKLKLIYQKYRFAVNCCLLSFCFLINCFWGQMIWIEFPILLIMILFDGLENGLSYIIFSIPFCMLTLYMSAFLFVVCIFAFMIKFYIILYVKQKEKPNILLLSLIGLFFVYSLLPFGPYNFNRLLKIGLFICLFAVLGIAIKRPNVLRLEFNIKILSLALAVSFVFSATLLFSPYLIETVVYSYADSRRRYQALLYHPNVLGMLCEILISSLAYVVIRNKARWWDYVLILILTFGGLMTMSKTFLLLISFVYFVVFICFVKRYPVQTICVFAGLLALGGIYGCINPKYIVFFLNRFGKLGSVGSFKEFMNVITTYRYDLWMEYLIYMAHNPIVIFFGKSFGAKALSTLSAHNALISMIYQLGIVGSAILIAIFVLMIKEFLKNATNKPSKAIWLPLLILFAILSVEDTIFFIFDIYF